MAHLKKMIMLMDKPEDLVEYVKTHAERTGYSVNKLCFKADVSYTTVWRWVRGSTPHLPTIHKLANVLDSWEKAYKQRQRRSS